MAGRGLETRWGAGELSGWNDQLDGVFGSAVRANPQLPANTAWITELYKRLLNRSPDPTGLAFWSNELSQGRLSRNHVVLGFVKSDENFQNLIANWHLQYLARAATPAEALAALVRMRGGASHRRIQLDIIDGVEYRNIPPPPPLGTAIPWDRRPVVGTNSPPTTSGISNIVTPQDSPTVSLNLFAAFADAEDADDVLRFSLVHNSNPSLFSSLAINGNPKACVVDYAPGAVGQGIVTIRATDLGGLFVDTSFTVELTASAPPGGGDNEIGSPGTISLSGASETTFNSTNALVSFIVSGALFSSDPDDVQVFHNRNLVPGHQLATSNSSVAFLGGMIAGRNDFEIFATDSNGLALEATVAVWAGTYTLRVHIVDDLGNPVLEPVDVVAMLADDHSVVATSTTTNGRATFDNLPDRTILFLGRTDDNRIGLVGVNGGTSMQVVLPLVGFGTPSPIPNNDFSSDTSGWDIGNAPVSIIPHVEGSAARMANPSAVPDSDLQLGTQGIGSQAISRTFVADPNARGVTIRYRFVSSEIPGGFFGTQYNDYYGISLRSQSSGGVQYETNSMNALGLSVFDQGGATAWRELTLPLTVPGDVIQVDATVANVADGQFDSQLVLDMVTEPRVVINRVDLKDLDEQRLQYLSVGAHDYFGGNTRVHGTISLYGEPSESLQSVVMEVIQGGNIVATADLSPSAKAALLGVPFGADGSLAIPTSGRLFDLPSTEAQRVDSTTDGSVSLRVRATTTGGASTTRDFGEVPILVSYAGSNRLGKQRDLKEGGDDWTKPSVKNVINHFSQILVNDLSNMNGGQFNPHVGHRNGTDVDGSFGGYDPRNAATATTILGMLDDQTIVNGRPVGSQIKQVLVSFDRVDTDPFWVAIKDETLSDGRRARDVIRKHDGHSDHFHMKVDP